MTLTRYLSLVCCQLCPNKKAQVRFNSTQALGRSSRLLHLDQSFWTDLNQTRWSSLISQIKDFSF